VTNLATDSTAAAAQMMGTILAGLKVRMSPQQNLLNGKTVLLQVLLGVDPRRFVGHPTST
jgi:hypothetical protein